LSDTFKNTIVTEADREVVNHDDHGSRMTNSQQDNVQRRMQAAEQSRTCVALLLNVSGPGLRLIAVTHEPRAVNRLDIFGMIQTNDDSRFGLVSSFNIVQGRSA
jgi:hypothetical protein